MKICDEISVRIYGEDLLEAFRLDLLLNALKNGTPRSKKIVELPTVDIPKHEIDRVVQKLLDDRLIKAVDDSYLITSDGILQLSKGGYVAAVKQSKRVAISFWISILAFIMASIAFVSRVFNW